MGKVAATVASNGYPAPTGYPDDRFDLPSEIKLDSPAYPDLWGKGGGTAAYRGNQDTEILPTAPAYAGTYGVGFVDAPGIHPTTQKETVPGSADLDAPRDVGGYVGTDRLIVSDGPVTGVNTPWANLRADIPSNNPNYSGPVTGGPDQAQKIAAAFFASQSQEYSQIATAAALVSAV